VNPEVYNTIIISLVAIVLIMIFVILKKPIKKINLPGGFGLELGLQQLTNCIRCLKQIEVYTQENNDLTNKIYEIKLKTPGRLKNLVWTTFESLNNKIMIEYAAELQDILARMDWNGKIEQKNLYDSNAMSNIKDKLENRLYHVYRFFAEQINKNGIDEKAENGSLGDFQEYCYTQVMTYYSEIKGGLDFYLEDKKDRENIERIIIEQNIKECVYDLINRINKMEINYNNDVKALEIKKDEAKRKLFKILDEKKESKDGTN
jgi:hypothetical protein